MLSGASMHRLKNTTSNIRRIGIPPGLPNEQITASSLENQRPAASPPRWTVDDLEACCVVKGDSGQNSLTRLFRGRTRTEIGGEVTHEG